MRAIPRDATRHADVAALWQAVAEVRARAQDVAGCERALANRAIVLDTHAVITRWAQT